MEYKKISEQCSNAIEVFRKASILVDDGKEDSIYLTLGKQLEYLKNRFAEQKINILVAGEVKSGKSTFINTLIGVDILATAPEVCTNVPIRIIYGTSEKIFVHFSPNKRDVKPVALEINRERINEFSTEKSNKENNNSVEFIEIQIDSPLLKEGLVFIDTPGLGAIDPLHAIETYKIASQADIIFFLGDVRKPLTQSEVASLKNLITVSKCEQVVNLLTCCDLKSPHEILQANQKTLKEEFAKMNIDIIPISSLQYRKYLRSGNRKQLDSSGFQQVRTFISDINAELKSLLDKRFNALTYLVCKKGYDGLAELVELVESPEATERKVQEIKALMERLQEIEDNQTIWSQQLSEKQRNFNMELSKNNDRERRRIADDVTKLLKNDYYLENKEELGKSISAELISFQKQLGNNVSEGFNKIYSWLRNETGLKDIEDREVKIPDHVAERIQIDEDAGNVRFGEKFRDVYVATSIGIITSGVASSAGVWAGGAAGAKIGAAIGSAVAPAIGTAIGAAVGALAGIIAGFAVFKGAKEARKKKQRNEISAVCNKQINDFFIQVAKEIESANIPNSTDLSIQFLKELKAEKKQLQTRHHNMKNEALRIRANYQAIKELESSIKIVCDQLYSHEA